MMDAAPTPSAPAPPGRTASPPPALRRSRLRLVLGAVLVCLFVAVAAYVYLPGLVRETTDDATIEAHVVTVTPKVSAYVAALHVDDNSPVKAGELLVELDPRDFQVQVESAEAALAAALGRLAEARSQAAVVEAQIGQTRAELQAAQANAQLAADNLRRVEGVADVRAVSRERLDTDRAAADSARADVAAAQMKVATAEAQAKLIQDQVKTAQAAVDQAKASLDQAKLDLSYTRIYASETGHVADKTVEAGNYVQPGQALFSVVPEKIFVVANFKETQMDRIRPGQRAVIHVDAFPELQLHGHVDSIQHGSGSRFALLPPENATGNFVKVVQRIPVKIVLDEPADRLRLLSPGMSVEVSVYFSQDRSWFGG